MWRNSIATIDNPTTTINAEQLNWNVRNQYISIHFTILQHNLNLFPWIRYCSSSGKQNDQNNKNNPMSSCGQCKIYREKLTLTEKRCQQKLTLAEKRCQQLEEFIRTNWNSASITNGNLLDVSMMTIENCTPVEVSTSSYPIGKEEILSDNDDASNFNGKDIFNSIDSNAKSKGLN